MFRVSDRRQSGLIGKSKNCSQRGRNLAKPFYLILSWTEEEILKLKGGVPFCEVCVGSVVICRAPFFCSGPLSSPLLSGGERKRGFLFIGLCTRYKAKTEAEEWEKGGVWRKLNSASFLSRDIPVKFDTGWPNGIWPLPARGKSKYKLWPKHVSYHGIQKLRTALRD